MNNLSDFFKLKLLKLFNNIRKTTDATNRLMQPNVNEPFGMQSSPLIFFLNEHFKGEKIKFKISKKISYGNVVLNIGSTWINNDPNTSTGWMCLTDENDNIIDVDYENALGVVKSVKILETYNKNGIETPLPNFALTESTKQNFLYGVYAKWETENNKQVYNYYLFKFNNFIDYYFAPFSLFTLHEFKLNEPFTMKEGEPPINFFKNGEVDYYLSKVSENFDNDALFDVLLISEAYQGTTIRFMSVNLQEGKVKYISNPAGINLLDLVIFNKTTSPSETWYPSQLAIAGSERGYNNTFILKLVYSGLAGGMYRLFAPDISIAIFTIGDNASYQLELKKLALLGGPKKVDETIYGIAINDVSGIVFSSPESVYIGVSYARFNFTTQVPDALGEIKILLFENLSGVINWVVPPSYEYKYWPNHKTFDYIKNTGTLTATQSYNLWTKREIASWNMWYRADSFTIQKSYFSTDKQFLITFKMLLKNVLISQTYIGFGFLTQDGMNVCLIENHQSPFERHIFGVIPFKEQNRIITLCHSLSLVFKPDNFISSRGLYNYGDINSIPSFFSPIDNDLQNFNIVEVKSEYNTKLAADTNILDFTTENNNLIYSTTLQRKTMNGLPNNLWTLISNTEQPIFQQSFEITKTIFEEKILNFVVSILFKLVDQNKFNNEFANSIAKIFLNKNDVSILENISITKAKIIFNSGIFKIINIEKYVTLDLLKKELSIHFFLTFKNPANFPTTYQLLSSNDVVIYESEVKQYDTSNQLLEIKHLVYYN